MHSALVTPGAIGCEAMLGNAVTAGALQAPETTAAEELARQVPK